MRLRVLAAVASLLAAACMTGSETDADAGAGSGTPGPVPTADAQAWLDLHNAVRRDAQPPPSPPLPALTWSANAAAVAQAWADGCKYQHNPGRGDRGENIAASAPQGHWSIADVGEGLGKRGAGLRLRQQHLRARNAVRPLHAARLAHDLARRLRASGLRRRPLPLRRAAPELGLLGLRLRAAGELGRAETLLKGPCPTRGQCVVGCAWAGASRGGGGVGEAAAAAGALSFFQRMPSVRL